MFWDRFYSLCIENGTKPNPVCKELGFSTAAATQWKRGSFPSAEGLVKIAERFNVSVDYLLGLTDQKEKTVPAGQSLTPMQAAALDMILKLPDSALLNLMSFLDSLQGSQQ